jgi:hypothetical protein
VPSQSSLHATSQNVHWNLCNVDLMELHCPRARTLNCAYAFAVPHSTTLTRIREGGGLTEDVPEQDCLWLDVAAGDGIGECS